MNRSHRFALSICVVVLATTRAVSSEGLDEEPLFLSTTDNGWAQPAVVEASLRFEGTATAEAAKEPAEPVRGQIDLSYRQTGLGTEAGKRRVVRSIDRLDSSLSSQDELPATGQLLVAEDKDRGALVAAVAEPLSRTQLDAVQLAADPLDIDAMLPDSPVRDGATWKVEREAIGRILRIEADTLCDVVAIVSDVTPTHVRLRFAGPVHGIVDGATTEIELRGVALFDRSLNRLTKFNLAWKESRAVGPATPAIQATAKLNLAVRPAGADERVTDDDRALAAANSIDSRLLVTPRGGWQLRADREWFVVADAPGATTLRRIDGNEIAAVTTLTTRTRTAISVPRLEQEVRNGLSSQLGQVVSTSVGKTERGDAWLTVASVGQAGERPVQWRHDHVSDGTSAVAITTTRIDEEDTLAEAAVRRLIGSLEPTSPTRTVRLNAAEQRR
ncbi:MAG: hypothetical protein AAF266_13685 [Planctomycetota bacterium]